MTTTVTVNARCDEATEVRVIVDNRLTARDNPRTPAAVMQSGESLSFTVYGDEYISVDEIPKTPESPEVD